MLSDRRMLWGFADARAVSPDAYRHRRTKGSLCVISLQLYRCRQR